jgi:molybdopterin converting factor subunit 1
MMVRVRLFARARDLAGTDAVTVDLPAGATVGELRTQLGKRVPALAALLQRSAFAVNNEFAVVDLKLTGDTEVALIPPVSGGCRA